MKKLLLGAAAVSLLTAACSATPDVIIGGESGEGSAAVGITVSGQGRVQGVPDTLTVNIGVSVLRDTADEAVAAAAEITNDLIDALASEGVAAEDLQTTNYSIFPEYDYSGDQRELVGFRVSNELVVKIRDLEDAGATFDAASAAAGDEIVVNGVQFALEDNEALLDVARAEAWADAENKATQLAELSGVGLGPPTAITESTSTAPPVLDARIAVDEALATPIEPGQVPVSVAITVTYSIAVG
jgi:hypothetical protein